MIPLEPDPREHCQLPVVQVSHGSRDDLDTHQIMHVEAQDHELEALQFMSIETSESRAELDASHRDITLVDTSGSRDELNVPQVKQVDTPSLFLIPVSPSSSDYLHSARTDKQCSFHTIS